MVSGTSFTFTCPTGTDMGNGTPLVSGPGTYTAVVNPGVGGGYIGSCDTFTLSNDFPVTLKYN